SQLRGGHSASAGYPPAPMTALATVRRRADITVAAVLDVVAVVLFVAIGRRSHDEGSAVTGTLTIVAPFLIALALAWGVSRAWRSPRTISTGVVVWLVTVVVGLALRRSVFDRGIAPSFCIVTTIVLGVFLLGWRALLARLGPRRLRSGS